MWIVLQAASPVTLLYLECQTHSEIKHNEAFADNKKYSYHLVMNDIQLKNLAEDMPRLTNITFPLKVVYLNLHCILLY